MAATDSLLRISRRMRLLSLRRLAYATHEGATLVMALPRVLDVGLTEFVPETLGFPHAAARVLVTVVPLYGWASKINAEVIAELRMHD